MNGRSARLPVRLGRALRSQALSFAGDLPVVGVAVAAAVLSASISAGIPADAAAAPEAAKEILARPMSTVIGVYAAVMAAVYGSFRYTIDRRTGVVAQRATLHPRAWALVGRLPFTALGGAIVGAAVVLGGRLALLPVLGVIGLEARDVGAVVLVGAVASLWGLGVGLLVQAHLPSLFLAPISLSAAMLIAPVWPAFSAWLPLPALLRASGLDTAVLGIAIDTGPSPDFAVPLASAWIVAVVAAGGGSFLRRDLR